MGQAIVVRQNYAAEEVRGFARRATDAAQARRLLAIAAVLDGASRAGAAKIGGMDRQTLRDWVIRYNEQGPDGLINIPSPGVPPKLKKEHKAFLARLVEDGPVPAIHGVVRWRACDLIMQLHERFGISVCDDTVYRALKQLGFSHVSARPRAYKQDPTAIEEFKKIPSTGGRNPCATCVGHGDRGVVSRRNAGRPKEQTHISLGSERNTAASFPGSAHSIDLCVRCSMPSTRSRRCSGPALL